ERVEEYERQVVSDDPFFIPWDEFLRQAEARGMTVVRVEENEDASLGEPPDERPSRSPSPQPSPQGEGELTAACVHNAAPREAAADELPLPRERAGMRATATKTSPAVSLAPSAGADEPRFIGLDAYRPLA